jgi:hypothetical protein
MLRAAVAAGTELGRKAGDIMERGALVPDDIVIGLIAERLDKGGEGEGFILDGFPRTIAQAEALDRLLPERGKTLDAVIEMQVDDECPGQAHHRPFHVRQLRRGLSRGFQGAEGCQESATAAARASSCGGGRHRGGGAVEA